MKISENMMRCPYLGMTDKKRMMCRCGDLQCHGNQSCHNCGGLFDIDPSTKTLYDVIKMKSQFQYGNDIFKSFRWHYEIYKRTLKNETFEDFISAFQSVSNEKIN